MPIIVDNLNDFISPNYLLPEIRPKSCSKSQIVAIISYRGQDQKNFTVLDVKCTRFCRRTSCRLQNITDV